MTAMLASAAAQEIGLPPKVDRWSPGFIASEIGVARGEGAEREAAGDALGHRHDVRRHVGRVLDAEHLAGAAEAGLHLIDDQQRPVRRGRCARRSAGTRPAA